MFSRHLIVAASPSVARSSIRGAAAVVAAAGAALLVAASSEHQQQHHRHNGRLHQSLPIAFLPVPSSRLAYCDAPAAEKANADNEPNKDRLAGWKARWDKGATRWHRGVADPSLRKYLDSHVLKGGTQQRQARILVPLAGKTVDMTYLAQHDGISQVVGVDGVRKAFEEFAEVNPELEVREQAEGAPSGSSFHTWMGKSILLLQGDFFDLDMSALGGLWKRNELKFDAVWDRASLVAINPYLREQYVDTIGKVVAPGGRILLSTYVRKSGDKTKGPPFSIDEDEVRRLYETQSWVDSVELLDVHGATANEPFFRAIMLRLRLGRVDEKIFLITAKK